MTFVQIFYAELEKRERDDNLSYCSARVVERSAHVPACSQAPVHPCSLTCSLVWNQLQKAAVILCYSASPILKAAIKVWHWLKAIQLAVTVKQKLRVNWNLFFFPPPSCALLFLPWTLEGVHSCLGKGLGDKNAGRMPPTWEKLTPVPPEEEKIKGKCASGRGWIFPQSCSALVLPP